MGLRFQGFHVDELINVDDDVLGCLPSVLWGMVPIRCGVGEFSNAIKSRSRSRIRRVVCCWELSVNLVNLDDVVTMVTSDVVSS